LTSSRQTIEQSIIDTLKEMIESVKKHKTISRTTRANGPSQQQDSKLIELLAELKMIRSMQIRIKIAEPGLRRRSYEGEQAPSPLKMDYSRATRNGGHGAPRVLKNLAERQLKVVDAVTNITGQSGATGTKQVCPARGARRVIDGIARARHAEFFPSLMARAPQGKS